MTNRNTARKAVSRNNETRAVRQVNYRPPNQLDVPNSLQEDYEREGYRLSWKRVRVDGSEDASNISKLLREGWEFVYHSELPEPVAKMYEKGYTRHSETNAIVQINDVALMKQLYEHKQARDDYFINRAVQQEAAVSKQLRGDARMNRLLPIIDESETTLVGQGGRATKFNKNLDIED